MRIAVISPRGQLGAAVVHECRPHHDVIPLDRAAVDVTDGAAVLRVLADVKPEAVINCSGYNAVDLAEQAPADAFAVNSFAVRALARAANELGATLVHYSSDFVFDGKTPRPLLESDRPNPKSAYAMSKLLGEWFAEDAGAAYVLRVESLFDRAPDGPPAKGTVAGIVNTLRGGGCPKVFRDRTVSPTSVVDAAVATRTLLEKGAPHGLYHCVNSGACTWLEFATEAARLLGVEPRFDVVNFADVRLPAARPQYCALSNAKLAAAGAPMPAWQEALARAIAAMD
jgi:dTDP-4-dehydrorhamnose reductase